MLPPHVWPCSVGIKHDSFSHSCVPGGPAGGHPCRHVLHWQISHFPGLACICYSGWKKMSHTYSRLSLLDLLLPRRDGGVGLDAKRGFLQVTSDKSRPQFSRACKLEPDPEEQKAAGKYGRHVPWGLWAGYDIYCSLFMDPWYLHTYPHWEFLRLGYDSLQSPWVHPGISTPILRQGLKTRKMGLSSICREGASATWGIPIFSNREGLSSIWTLLCMQNSFLELWAVRGEGHREVRKAQGPRGGGDHSAGSSAL